MLSTAFWIIVGIIVGWKFNQPDCIKSVETKVVGWAKLAWAWVKSKVSK
jgi:hypothetical protein